LNPSIQIRGLSKRYRIGRLQQGRTLREEIVELAKRPFVRGVPDSESIWALKDVSFDVGDGEVVGIIGNNGAGKSTLLKILSKITYPTEGNVKVKGRVASLLEVGTGFHEELTGRENVYLNGSILGMRKREVDKHFDAIVAFWRRDRPFDVMLGEECRHHIAERRCVGRLQRIDDHQVGSQAKAGRQQRGHGRLRRSGQLDLRGGCAVHRLRGRSDLPDTSGAQSLSGLD